MHFGRNVIISNYDCVKVGDNSSIGEGSKLLTWKKFRDCTYSPLIQIGNRVHITRNLTIQCINNVILEDDVLIASDCFFIDYNHGLNPTTNNYLDNSLEESDGIHIKKGAWIGNNVIILGGVSIGEKSIVGAGSVVTKSIPPYSIAVGNPAKVVKKYDFGKQKWDTYLSE